MLAGEPTPKGTGLGVLAGKEDPVEFDSSLIECSSMEGVAQVGSARQLMALIMAFAAISTVGSSFWMRLRAATRKLAMKYHYLHSRFTNRMIRVRQPLAPLGARPRGTSLASCLTASPLRVPTTVRDTAQMGSLAGAAHLVQDNASVPKHCSGGTETPHRGAGQRHC